MFPALTPRPTGLQSCQGSQRKSWEGKVHLSMPKAQASVEDLPQGRPCSLSSLQHQEQEAPQRRTLIHPGVWNPCFIMETFPSAISLLVPNELESSLSKCLPAEG